LAVCSGAPAESKTETVRSAITVVWPDLPVAVLDTVEDALNSLSAETTDDLRFIKEADLLPQWKPIQARNLVVAWAHSSKCNKFHTVP
jgi:hypothetical protein